jgi:rifampicin monooxygenase
MWSEETGEGVQVSWWLLACSVFYLANTRAQGVLIEDDPGAKALRELFSELLDFEDVNRYVTEMITAIRVRYDFGEGHELLGRRMRTWG